MRKEDANIFWDAAVMKKEHFLSYLRLLSSRAVGDSALEALKLLEKPIDPVLGTIFYWSDEFPFRAGLLHVYRFVITR